MLTLNPRNPFDILPDEAQHLSGDAPERPCIGHWKEPRLIYTTDEFNSGPWKASDRRTVHMGVDIFAAAATEIFCPLNGTVHAIKNCTTYLDYGGCIILRHDTENGDAFYALYGHLDPEVCRRLSVGDKIQQGQSFARLGSSDVNVGWDPHLHRVAIWPGVADPDDIDFYSALFPNPAGLLNICDKKIEHQASEKNEILNDRKDNFSDNLSLSYSNPVMLVRGWRHHLFDEWGRSYLDAYNNVPHVGHAHPRISAVVTDQLSRINTNTRYLHPAQNQFAQKLLEKLPDQFTRCFFVNSGSEANELALRLARSSTGGTGIVTPDHGYHGNTSGAMDISAYKFNAPGGHGKPDWVELVDIANGYRGRYDHQDPDYATKYADQVKDAIAHLIGVNISFAVLLRKLFHPSVVRSFRPRGI